MSEQKKQGLRQRLAARYGARAEGAKNTVVMQGEREVTVYGCRRILQYSPKEIRLSLGKRALSVIGDRLFCPSFSAGTVTVQGCVRGVSFLDDDEDS